MRSFVDETWAEDSNLNEALESFRNAVARAHRLWSSPMAYREEIRFRRYFLKVAARGGGISLEQARLYLTWMIAAYKASGTRTLPLPNPEALFESDSLSTPVGRPTSPITIALCLDAILLWPFTNRYLHLARDALSLRLTISYKTTTERLNNLQKEISWAETTSRRVWDRISDDLPPVLPDRWWHREERRLKRRFGR